MTKDLTAADAAELLAASPTKSATSLHGEVRDSEGYTLAYVKTTRYSFETESTHPVCLTYAEQVAVAALFAAAPSLARALIRVEGERDEAREMTRGVLGACVVPATRQIAYAGDLPMYVRACFDAAEAEHCESVAQLTRAVDAATERIGEVVAERDELALTLANERGEGTPPGDLDWEYDHDQWEWRARIGAATADEATEPIDATATHTAEMTHLDSPPGLPWFWEAAEQRGQGDTGDPFADGFAASARQAMIDADAAVTEYQEKQVAAYEAAKAKS